MNLNIALLCLVIVLFLIILFKSREGFSTVHPIPTAKINLNLREYVGLTNGLTNNNASFSNKLSKWESGDVLDNPRLRKMYSLLYNRSCAPALVSRMGNYAIYLPQIEQLQ